MTLSVVTPSYINNQQRADWARDSLASLRETIGDGYLHVVVLDKSLEWNIIAQAIYNQPNVMLMQRPKPLGNTSALLKAVKESRKLGADLCFVHMDDNIYVPEFGPLLRYAQDAFSNDRELQEVLFVGYPILIKRHSKPLLGNRTGLTIEENQVSFDTIQLHPTRCTDYTLWWSYFHDRMVDGRFWAVVMWMALYRAEFLESVLTLAPTGRTLGQVESYYRNRSNWERLSHRFPGKLGYINMQFGGLEMHHHSQEWCEMIRFPNTPVR